LSIELLNAGGPGIGHDQLEVSGQASLGGELVVSLDPGFEPEVGQSFVIVDAGSLFDTFTTVVLPDCCTWELHYDFPANGQLSLEALDVPVSLDELAASAGDLLVFPNPARDLLQIDLSPWSGKAIELSVVNLQGMQLWKRSIDHAPTGTFSAPIDLPAGPYRVVVRQDDRRWSAAWAVVR
ncbi:MAG: hypothetical protein KDC43_17785, partial [Saprospiraceae bacterium]|nr:hypothetical protein [Saprospiraceae bacterium]MCB0625712.1 hypothetical protein [Saprospiraceae bacterium]MCB0681183.1 hypothetical protein [Saprospiraceae bacterium]